MVCTRSCHHHPLSLFCLCIICVTAGKILTFSSVPRKKRRRRNCAVNKRGVQRVIPIFSSVQKDASNSSIRSWKLSVCIQGLPGCLDPSIRVSSARKKLTIPFIFSWIMMLYWLVQGKYQSWKWGWVSSRCASLLEQKGCSRRWRQPVWIHCQELGKPTSPTPFALPLKEGHESVWILIIEFLRWICSFCEEPNQETVRIFFDKRLFKALHKATFPFGCCSKKYFFFLLPVKTNSQLALRIRDWYGRQILWNFYTKLMIWFKWAHITQKV